MKNRELSILYAILQNNGETMGNLLERFPISKRTLYYDIRNINYEIKEFGKIKKVMQQFVFLGNYNTLQDFIRRQRTFDFLDTLSRHHYLIRLALQGRLNEAERLYGEFGFSKNTKINDLRCVKDFLKENGLTYRGAPHHAVTGDEVHIRNLYLQFLSEDKSGYRIPQDIVEFNQKFNLRLSDQSLSRLADFVDFLRYRIARGLSIQSQLLFGAAQELPYFNEVSRLLGSGGTAEQNYIALYISTLPSLKQDARDDTVERYLDCMIDKFEQKAALVVEDREEFKKNIRHHMLALYRRIRFHFPSDTENNFSALNLEHEPLYKIIRSIAGECEGEFPEYKNLSEEELCYLTAYFGGYLSDSSSNHRRKKVLLICPNGLTVSKTLQFRLAKYFSALEIVDTIALNQLEQYEQYYDAIISTVSIPNYNNVVVISPAVNGADIEKIMQTLYDFPRASCNVDIDQLMQVIEGNAQIFNRNKLKNDLMALLYKNTINRRTGDPMLKDLITEQKITVVQHVEDWENAIKLAAKPLLDDKSIEPSYVTAMIESVHTYGAYIVLDDYFALPHAKSKVGVNRLGMSLLVVRDAVDLLGKPVNIFLVLAAVDTTSHLNALGTLSDILGERKNIELFRTGNKQKILDLIDRYSQTSYDDV